MSTGGVSCRAFAECVQLLADSNIDYDGPGGVLDIGPEGDPVRARFDLFEFDDTGVSWRGHHLSVSELVAARGATRSFGSCSFREPIDDLTALELL